MDVTHLMLLAAAFFVVALIYASVGFGGGSSYTALLALVGLSTVWIPVLSLCCNVVVVSGGCWHFARRGQLDLRRVGPFLVGSLPAAYFAGRTPLDPGLYLLVLAWSLLAAALLLVLRPTAADHAIRPCPLSAGLFAGAALGALSGLVGIGGGIFLSPLLLLARWATPKQSAAAASLFILVNSIAGLAGQLSKPGAVDALVHLPALALAVLLGGQIGSRWGAGILPAARIRQITAALIAIVAVRILLQQLV